MSNISERSLDLRSDTVTLPTKAMRESVLTATLGDDVFGDDPTVAALQEKVASLLGKEDALFVPSGTMGNLICVLIHCWGRGCEVIVGDESHININEQGGMAQIGNVFHRTVRNLPDGTFSLDEMAALVRPDDVHFPVTSLVCIENTHNRMGGKVLPLQWIDQIGAKCHELGLPIHVDGARLLNAALALDVPPARLVRDASTVTLCLSKGIGAPVGSVIAGSKEIMKRGHRLRKVLGGGMRQSGVLAAMAIVALEEASATLLKDHCHLETIIKGILKLESNLIEMHSERNLTNISFLELNPEKVTADQFCDRMAQCTDREQEALGERITCKMIPLSKSRVRVVTNRNLSDEDIDVFVKKVGFIIREIENQKLIT